MSRDILHDTGLRVPEPNSDVTLARFGNRRLLVWPKEGQIFPEAAPTLESLKIPKIPSLSSIPDWTVYFKVGMEIPGIIKAGPTVAAGFLGRESRQFLIARFDRQAFGEDQFMDDLRSIQDAYIDRPEWVDSAPSVVQLGNEIARARHKIPHAGIYVSGHLAEGQIERLAGYVDYMTVRRDVRTGLIASGIDHSASDFHQWFLDAQDATDRYMTVDIAVGEALQARRPDLYHEPQTVRPVERLVEYIARQVREDDRLNKLAEREAQRRLRFQGAQADIANTQIPFPSRGG